MFRMLTAVMPVLLRGADASPGRVGAVGSGVDGPVVWEVGLERFEEVLDGDLG